jgi:hypothetical protein
MEQKVMKPNIHSQTFLLTTGYDNVQTKHFFFKEKESINKHSNSNRDGVKMVGSM